MKPVIHVASVSSGKDSQATMVLMIERVGKENCRFVMCDTGNEDEAVFEHKAYLEGALGITIDVLRAEFKDRIANKRMFIARDRRVRKKRYRLVDKHTGAVTHEVRVVRWSNKAKHRALAALHATGNPFLDLCLWKGRFPSRKAQFCTQELKTIPLVEYQIALQDAGYNVVSWQGIRRDESANRRETKLFERIGKGLWTFRPIILWTAQQTVDFCTSRGLRLNRLYSEGFDRVGCMPCMNCGKKEIKGVALRRPAAIERLHQWEKLVGQACKRGVSSFFPNPHRDDAMEKNGIHNIVQWAKTTRGGRQFDLIPETDPGACTSSYGLCDAP